MVNVKLLLRNMWNSAIYSISEIQSDEGRGKTSLQNKNTIIQLYPPCTFINL